MGYTLRRDGVRLCGEFRRQPFIRQRFAIAMENQRDDDDARQRCRTAQCKQPRKQAKSETGLGHQVYGALASAFLSSGL